MNWFEKHLCALPVKRANRISPSSFGDLVKRSAEEDAEYREFMEWFGDSVVVDERGRPLKVYHGSPNADISSLSKQDTAFGFFFSPDEMTAEYYTGGDGKVYHAYLKIENLLDLTDEAVRHRAFDEVFGGGETVRMVQDRYGEMGEVDKEDLMNALVEIHTYHPELLGELMELAPGLSETDDEFEPIDAFYSADLSWLDIDLMDDSSPLKTAIEEMFTTVDEDVMYVERAYGSQDFYMNYQDDVMMWAAGNGYDGVLFDDPSPTGQSLSFVVFSPDKIRFVESVAASTAANVKTAQTREIIYVNRSGGLPPVEIIKNPTGDDHLRMSREFQRENPHAPESWKHPRTRTTYDPGGNTYLWRSDMGLHANIEPQLAMVIGRPVNQNRDFELFEVYYPDVNIRSAGANRILRPVVTNQYKNASAESIPPIVYHGTNETKYVDGVRTEGDPEAKAELQEAARIYGFKNRWMDMPGAMQRWLDTGYMPESTPPFMQDDVDRYRNLLELTHGRYTPGRVEMGFEEFMAPEGEQELGMHFGTREQAEMLGEPFAFHLDIKNPIRLDDLGTWNYQLVMRELRKAGVKISEEEYEAVFNATDNNRALRELMLSKGIDGVVYGNKAEDHGDSYIALLPSQIKRIHQQDI